MVSNQNPHKVYYEGDVHLPRRLGNAHQILNVYIDLSGWDGSFDPNERGIYSYSLDFNDMSCKRQRVVCTGVRSNGMKTLLDEVHDRYGLTLCDATDVYILAPAGCIANSSVKFGCVSKCSVQSLRLYGMQALDFAVSDRNNMNKRLESVLDEVVYQTCRAYDNPLPRRRIFENSIYHYDKEDTVRYSDSQFAMGSGNKFS